MSLLDLPNELILEIAEYLDPWYKPPLNLSKLSRVNQRLNHLLGDRIFHYNIQHQDSDALIWAARMGNYDAASKMLSLGANVKTVTYRYTVCHGTPVQQAAVRGYDGLVRLFLENGASPSDLVRYPSWRKMAVDMAMPK